MGFRLYRLGMFVPFRASGFSFSEIILFLMRTSPMPTQHRLDIGWSATCDREFTIVVRINIVMSYGSSHMHATLNTKQT